MPLTRTIGTHIICSLDNLGERHDWETFTITHNPDGSRTAQTLSRFPGTQVVRHVTQTVAADFTPVDGVSRLFIDNVYQGMLVRRVVDGVLTSILFPADGGPIDLQTIPFDHPDTTLGYHPSSVESWKLMKISRIIPGPQTMHLLTLSHTWNGGTLEHAIKLEAQVEYLGEETITTPAGTFDCHHYVWHTLAFDGDLDIWITGEDAVVVRMDGSEKRVRYELDSYVVKTFDDARELVL
ncbi:hypothetical protein [Novosphingobium resinovorum]|uniref:hypothetical protein n=1 Tax=Novosphingobium resinovorum TaxID=158500 RepID=UPI002ED2A24F|nr:hypothetical protein [Novosphingobium resinovorum]